MTAADFIARYQLQPHPEGGWYREIHRADESVASPVHGEARSPLTHIYFLLERGQVSRFHRVLHTEVWNVYHGAPLRLIRFDPAVPETIHDVVLGGEGDDAHFTAIVEPGHYQAAESTGDHTLVGCTVAPGFDFADFSFLADDDAGLAERVGRSSADLGRFA